MNPQLFPKAFIWRRLHSIAGLWLVAFLMLHLLTNSQAALFIHDDGQGFIHGANALESLPFLPILELLVLGVPILIHIVWGIQYLRSAEYNSYKTNGSTPDFHEYPRNKAYTWQRITSWILVIGIIAHVVQMRFVDRPLHAQGVNGASYMVRVNFDEGLYTLAERLNFDFYDRKEVEAMTKEFHPNSSEIEKASKEKTKVLSEDALIEAQAQHQEKEWLAALSKRPLKDHQVIIVADNFGTADLMMLRETFKSPIMILLYTLLVLAASFHAFNGLWTFLIKWGVILTPASQRLMLKVTYGLMILFGFLGLAAVWGTYWLNLKS